MGYYGLLVPGTAVAKDASGAKWQQGFIYLANFNRPYYLWVAAVLLVALAVVLLALRNKPWWTPTRSRPDHGRLARAVQSPTAAVVFMVVSGLLQGVYWIRQGGDFMHGRVLLTPVFCLLAPIAVIPIVVPDGAARSREVGYLLAAATSVLWLGVVGWSVWAANSPGMGSDATRVTHSGIVDERKFYAQATGHAHPLTAADYLDYPRMRAVLAAIDNTPDGALLLPSGNYDQWDVVPAIPGALEPIGQALGRPPNEPAPHTVFFTNLGMLGMNVGLDVRVIDQIGLANPLAAHTARLDDAQDRPRQESVPGLGRRRGSVSEGAAVHPVVSGRGLGRPGRGGPRVPGDRRDADLGAGPVGGAEIPVERAPRCAVHPVSDRQGAALRARPVWADAACAQDHAVRGATGNGALTCASAICGERGLSALLTP